jgi:hypothetical protein
MGVEEAFLGLTFGGFAMKRKNLSLVVCGLAGTSSVIFGAAQSVHASILASTSLYGTGPIDTVYSDNFTAPAVNVNSATTDPNAIVGNAVAGGDGGSGGTPGATYIGIAPPAATGAPDADWDYSGSSSATITSPAANVVTGEDTSTITNLTLPLIPVVGRVYDFQISMLAAPGTGAHGLEMAFLYNGGNGHNTAAQAISNNDPIGLVLDRDAASGGGYLDLFQGTGTSGDTHFAPTATALTGGNPGTTVTVDELFTPTGTGTTGTVSWYLNGILANSSPIAVTTLTGGVSDIQFGDNRDASGTFTNFSLTSQAVPEPASVSLLALVGGLMLGRRKRCVLK